MREILIGLAVFGNIVVWGIAYVGYSRGGGDSDFETASRTEPSVQLQLLTIQTPTRAFNGRRGNRTRVSITLEVPDPAYIPYICRLTPRVRDALIQVLHRDPPQYVSRRDLDFTRQQPNMLEATNRALGREYVDDLIVRTGARPIPKDAASGVTKSQTCLLLEKTSPLRAG